MTPLAALWCLGQVVTPTTARSATVSIPLPKLWIAPPRDEVARDKIALDAQAGLVFGAEVADAARATFLWRRWDLASAEALTQLGLDPLGCADDVCLESVALAAGATHWLAVHLSSNESVCLGTVSLKDLYRGIVKRLDERIEPCTPDRLLSAAARLGDAIAEGPRAPPRITVNLTLLTLPDLDLPDVPNVTRQVSTATRTRTGPDLEQALLMYREQHVIAFDEGDSFFVARGGKLLTECDLRRAASAPISPEIRNFCDGNDWEWAWIGTAAGGLVAWGSSSGLDEGNTVSVFGFGIGLGSALVCAGLAIFLDQDRQDPSEGSYFSPREDLEALVQRNNSDLRRVLDLTEAEVELAGMRL